MSVNESKIDIKMKFVDDKRIYEISHSDFGVIASFNLEVTYYRIVSNDYIYYISWCQKDDKTGFPIMTLAHRESNNFYYKSIEFSPYETIDEAIVRLNASPVMKRTFGDVVLV